MDDPFARMGENANSGAEDAGSSDHDADSGSEQNANESMKIFLDAALRSLNQACLVARGPHARRRRIAEHFNVGLSHVQKLESIYSQTIGELRQEKQVLADGRKELEDNWEYFRQLQTETIKHLNWLEDPLDPSTQLENIADPRRFGRLVEKRFRDICDKVDKFSRKNSVISQKIDNLSQANVELKARAEALQSENLSQRETIVEARKERDDLSKTNDDLGRVIADLKSRSETLQKENLDQRESIGQAEKEREDLSLANIELKARVEALQNENLTKSESIVRVEKERDDLSKINDDLSKANNDLSKAHQGHLREIADLKAKYEALRSDYNRQLDATRRERDRLHLENTQLAALKKDLNSNLGQLERESTDRLNFTKQERDHFSKENLNLTALNKRLEEKLQLQIRDSATQLQIVMNQRDAATKENVDLQWRYQALQEDYSLQVNATKQTEWQRDAFSQANAELTDRVGILMAEVSAKNENIEHVTKDHNRVLNENESNKERLARAQGQLRLKTETASAISEYNLKMKAMLRRNKSLLVHAKQRKEKLSKDIVQMQAHMEHSKLIAAQSTTALTEQEKQTEAAREQAEQAKTDAERLRLKSGKDDLKILVLNKNIASLRDDVERLVEKNTGLLNDIRNLTSNPQNSLLEVPVDQTDANLSGLVESNTLPKNTQYQEVKPRTEKSHRSHFLEMVLCPQPSTPAKRGSDVADINNDSNSQNPKRPC